MITGFLRNLFFDKPLVCVQNNTEVTMTQTSFPSRNIWILWGAHLSSGFIMGIVFYAIRQTTMKDVSPILEEPFLQTVRFVAAGLILLLWFAGYAMARRTIRLAKPEDIEYSPDAASRQAQVFSQPVLSSALITWALFEVGFLVSLIYWFLSLDLVTILPGMILHVGSLLYFNPAHLGFMGE